MKSCLHKLQIEWYHWGLKCEVVCTCFYLTLVVRLRFSKLSYQSFSSWTLYYLSQCSHSFDCFCTWCYLQLLIIAKVLVVVVLIILLLSSLLLQAITSSGTKKGELLLADVSTQIKNNNITTDIKVDTNSRVSLFFFHILFCFYLSTIPLRNYVFLFIIH